LDVVRFDNSCTADALAAAVREHGYAIVDNLVDVDLMDRIGAEMRPFVAMNSKGFDALSGFDTKRTGAMIARSPSSRELVMNPLTLATAKRTLDKASSFRLNLTQLMSIFPGAEAQPLHRDQLAWDFFPFPIDYDVQFNVIWAMTNFTEENGATHVVPGSHKLAAGPEVYTHDDTIRAAMSKGSAVFYTGKVIHGGGANRTGEIRHGINITYAVGWVCQEENQYLTTPLELARTLPVDLLKVMGYQLSCYAMGYVADARDPITVVQGKPGDWMSPTGQGR
jgi:ectoine hydroxylase-related dioxygenase (phytanoyl-CoA dioxygenase family)